MNKQQTIDEMKKQIEELSKNLEVLEKSKDKVEFLQEGNFVNLFGNTSTVVNPLWTGHKRALTFATEEIAKKVDRITQQSYKIAQYVFQKEPDYVPDWSNTEECKFYILYNYKKNAYGFDIYTYNEILGAVFMPSHVAEQLVEDLNNGDYSID